MTQLGELDPDPTPTATPWEEYLAAAQSLDAVRRDAAAAAAAATRTASAARAELAGLQARLELQRARLTGEAVRAGLAAPQLAPTPAEQAAADTAVAAGGVPEALHRCQHLIETADAHLAGTAPAPRPGRLRWLPRPLWLFFVAAIGVLAALGCAVLLLIALAR